MTTLELLYDPSLKAQSWVLIDRGTQKPPRSYTRPPRRLTKREALRAATAYCRQHATPEKPISLIIRKLNGTFQEERTYPRSQDPRRSKG